MTHIQIHKRTYRELWHEGKTHQEIYDTLRSEIQESPEELANIICAVPSPKRNNEKRTLWLIYILLLADVAGIRVYALMNLPSEAFSNYGYLVPTILFSIVVPVYAIMGASRARMMSYGWAGISLLTTIILLFAQEQYVSDTIVYITAALAGAAMILAGIIPRVLKRKYEKTVEKTEVDGKVKSRLVITFPEN